VLSITETISARTSYPILPWVGIISLGYLSGNWFAKGYSASKRHHYLIISSIVCAVLFIGLRSINLYGEANLFAYNENDITKTVMSFFNLTKYPPSLLFSLMTLSAALLLLAKLENVKNSITDILLVFGRAPLFYYIAHLYTLHIAYSLTVWALNEPRYSVMHISIVWLICVVTLIVLFPATRWFGELKRRTHLSLLKYL
jgi:uncharacterized membrane protein